MSAWIGRDARSQSRRAQIIRPLRTALTAAAALLFKCGRLLRLLFQRRRQLWAECPLHLVNAFCPEPTALFDYAFGGVLFFMIAFSNIFVALLTVSVLGGLISRPLTGVVARAHVALPSDTAIGSCRCSRSRSRR